MPIKQLWTTTAGVILLLGILVTAAWAASPIRLMVNGQEIAPDVPPQLMYGRVMVPVRWVAEALGAQVEWDGQNRVVRVITRGRGASDLWSDQVEATDPEIREAVAMVSRYLVSLMSPSGASLEGLATAKALDTSQTRRIFQPFMLTGENKIVRFTVLDARRTDDGVEVAARRYQAEALSENQAAYVDEVYIVVGEERTGSDGAPHRVLLIDRATVTSSGFLQRDLVW